MEETVATKTQDAARAAEAAAAAGRRGTQALVLHEGTSQLDAVRAVFKMPKRDREAIAAFLNIDPENPALPAYIALCVKHNLSPFLGEIYLIEQKVKIRNADGTKEDKYRLKPGAGRDGFLSVAQKSGVFRGVQGDVVCANDTFAVDWSVRPEEAPRVTHVHAPLIPGKGAASRSYRGPIIGAWAKASRADGALPIFYFAPLKEHGKTHDTGDGLGWQGAWTYTSAMILKAAQSYVLRIAFSITGVVPLDEMRADPQAVAEEFGEGVVPTVYSDLDDVDWPEGELGERLRKAVERANELAPNRFSAATVEMLISGQPEPQLVRIADELEGDIAAAEEGTEAEPVDAEVVGQEGRTAAAIAEEIEEVERQLSEAAAGTEAASDLSAQLDSLQEELHAAWEREA